MKKEYHLKYIDHTEFKKLYKEWAAKVNNPLHVKVWDMAENFVKAQERKNNALSLDSLTEGENSFCKLMFLDEYGEVQYEYDK